ncbi:carbohydrate ABC transporter permease [Lachnotalea sp. AF33-28]|jgi:oligogalacturonide transport system permease protein|uniref:carbohydrate ABC transporter permease n=1 Tax=Lachnotalea sp. AF33-28 TaxID=2292046 RepID=UPI000E471A28|nr:carbohydrate ABC transporter permease [Lachnotalea sp. AF33-28]RHP36184.1 carbohydrate ABC transporter permease [Lachnotalea sp. AF33-28]
MVKRKIKKAGLYIVVTATAVIMGYPLLWLFFAAFKDNAEIFTSIALLPEKFTLEGFINGWKSTAAVPFSLFLLNSCKMVAPTVLLTAASACLVAYGFSRFEFAGRKVLFTVMLSTMMLPNTVIMIPRYILFNNFGWLNSYIPFYIMAAMAANPFFTYLLVQFFRGIPADLDEAAYIDGAGKWQILIRVILPLAKAPIVSAALFQTVWTWNDFFNPLLYIDRVKAYPVSLGLRLAIDADSVVNWNSIIAMSCVSLLPVVLLFVFLQKYFVQGIATTGMKN